MNKIKHHSLAKKRSLRVRSKLKPSSMRARLSVFRSNKYLYAQVIGEAGKILLASNELMLKSKLKKESGTKSERSKLVAEDLVKKLKLKKITQLQFDRAGYKYHGRIKILAEILRESGISI